MQGVNEDDDEGEGGTVVQAATNLIDSLVGKYKSAAEVKIGDRKIDELVEVKEKNRQMFRNFRKFENQCKKHPVEEKCSLVLFWC